MKKKAQLTMFIIMGIVIFVSFLFLFFISDFLAVEQLEQQRETITEQPFETAQVQYFASVCVDDALKTGLLLIGKQGGFIYESQGGVETPDELPLPQERIGPHEVRSVGISIAPRPQAPPPLYPCLESFLGKDPVFCKHGMLPVIVNYGGVILPPLDGGVFSIKGHLSRYVESYVEDCIDITNFASSIGLEAYNLQALGDVQADIKFLDTEVQARVAYPIGVDVSDNPVTQFVHFETSLPIRFKALYGAIQDLARKDITNETFEIDVHHSQAAFTVNSARENELVKFATLTPIPSMRKESSGFDDIFIIDDPVSIIEAQPYQFRLGRKNRAPALHFLQWNATYWYDTADNTKEFCPNCYDFLAIQNRDGTITFDNVQRDSTTGEIINHDPKAGKFALNAHDPDDDSFAISVDGPLGTSSLPFIFTPAAQPPGFYEQTITATDSNDADTQTLRVLVDENLVAGIRVTNYYGTNVITPEDPFQLDAYVSGRSVEDQTQDDFATHRFEWDVFAATAGFSTKGCSQLPFVGLGIEYPACDFTQVPPIETITTATLDSTNPWQSQLAAGGRPGIIDLTVRREYSNRVIEDTAQLQIPVAPCIVHSSSDNPWPYNRGDPYRADHACCAADPADPTNPLKWNIKPATEVCHSEPQCDSSRYLLADLTHMCDGKRGNICGPTGSKTLQRRNPLQCGDRSFTTCLEVPSRCATQPPWSIIDGVWCTGTFGCSEICTQGEVVDRSRNDWDPAVTPNNEVRFQCGCFFSNAGKACKKTTAPYDTGVCGSFHIIPSLNNVGECM